MRMNQQGPPNEYAGEVNCELRSRGHGVSSRRNPQRCTNAAQAGSGLEGVYLEFAEKAGARYGAPDFWACVLLLCLGQRADGDLAIAGFWTDPNGISQRAAHSFELNLHPVAVLERDIVAEAQGVSTIEVHMHRARLPVAFKLEVMVFQVGEAVAHVVLAGGDGLRPERFTAAQDADLAGNGVEIRVDRKLRANAAGAQLRSCKVEIVALLELMIGELIAHCHADAIWRSVFGDDVDASDLGFFATIFPV